MARLTFALNIRNSSDDSDDTVIVGAYTVPVNPFDYKKPRMELTKKIETLDGPGGYQHAPYNYGIHKFIWGKLPAEQQYYDMATQLREYNGKYIFVKEGSAGTDRNETWKRIIVINVIPKYDNAPNSEFYYKSLEFVFALAPHKEYDECNWISEQQTDSPWEPPPSVPAGKRHLSEIMDPLE